MSNFQDSLVSIFSRLSNLGSNRYVQNFKRAPLALTEGRKGLVTDAEKEAFALVEAAGKLIESMVGKYPILQKLDERIYLSIVDLDDLHITAIVRGGSVSISLGWDVAIRPTLRVPLFVLNLKHLLQIVSNKELVEEEIYRIARVLFIPFTKALYDVDFFYTPGDKRYLKLYNIYHVELTGMEHVAVSGFPGNAKATVVNIDGEWLVFEGFQGTPKMKVTCSLKQALEYYNILMIEMKRAKTAAEKKTTFEKYMELRRQTVTDLT